MNNGVDGWPPLSKHEFLLVPKSDQPSWAGQALDILNDRGGSDPRRVDELGDVSEVRLVADHDVAGGLYLLVLGTGAQPMLSYRIPPEFLAELRRPDSNAMLRCRAGHPAASLVTPPGELPLFFKTRRAGTIPDTMG